jgi:hypothetical protein
MEKERSQIALRVTKTISGPESMRKRLLFRLSIYRSITKGTGTTANAASTTDRT